MKTIRERYHEIIDSDPNCRIRLTEIFDIINKEYFDNNFNIRFKDSICYINDRYYKSLKQFIDYLDSLYELRSIKNKINRIYEIT